MAERTAVIEPAVDELKRRARRRLVGAVVLALAAAVILPMLLEKEPRPLGEDVAVNIPPVDDGKFTNQTSVPAAESKSRSQDSVKAVRPPAVSPAPAATAVPTTPAASAAPPRTVQESATGSSDPSIAPGANAPTVAEPSILAGANGSTARNTAADSALSRDAEAATSRKTVADAEHRVLSPAAGGVVTEVKPQSALEPKPGPRVESKSQSKTSPPALESVGKGASNEGFVVQLAAFSDDKGANALASKLKRIGYPAFTEPVHTSRGTLFRVRIGGYVSREAAGEARNKLKGEGYTGIVTSARSTS